MGVHSFGGFLPPGPTSKFPVTFPSQNSVFWQVNLIRFLFSAIQAPCVLGNALNKRHNYNISPEAILSFKRKPTFIFSLLFHQPFWGHILLITQEFAKILYSGFWISDLCGALASRIFPEIELFKLRLSKKATTHNIVLSTQCSSSLSVVNSSQVSTCLWSFSSIFKFLFWLFSSYYNCFLWKELPELVTPPYINDQSNIYQIISHTHTHIHKTSLKIQKLLFNWSRMKTQYQTLHNPPSP